MTTSPPPASTRRGLRVSDAAASSAGLVGPVGVTAPLGAGAAPEETPEEMPEGGPGADHGTAR